MSVDFQKSETRENLMRAFAGESQARNRYTFAARQARSQKLPVIEAVFAFTAEQERAHAKIFYDHLKPLAGSTIHVDGGYPVDLYTDIGDLLKAARHNEYEEHDLVYKSFSEIAQEEGFSAIAASFRNIAAIEKTHGDRFDRFARLLEEGRLFSSDTEETFLCLNCGHIYTGREVPSRCPVCQEEQGYFVRLQGLL